jgi:hypothetical protein
MQREFEGMNYGTMMCFELRGVNIKVYFLMALALSKALYNFTKSKHRMSCQSTVTRMILTLVSLRILPIKVSWNVNISSRTKTFPRQAQLDFRSKNFTQGSNQCFPFLSVPGQLRLRNSVAIDLVAERKRLAPSEDGEALESDADEATATGFITKFKF